MLRTPFAGRIDAVAVRRWVSGALALTCAVVLTAGCSRVKLPGGGGDADDRYGYAPKPDDSVVYQPDVVLVEGGGKAIRSVSDDGFTYVVDGDAPGADELQPGKIMFATSQAVGRVVRVENSGGDRAVTLAPVQLTDVVRDADITFDQPLDLTAQQFSPLPDLLGEVVEEDAPATPVLPDAADATGLTGNAIGLGGGMGGGALGLSGRTGGGTLDLRGGTGGALGLGANESELSDLRIAVPPIVLGPARAPGGGGATHSMERKIGGWGVTAYLGRTKVGLTAQHSTAASGLKVDFDIQLLLDNLRLSGNVKVTNGVIPHPRFRIDGVHGLAITVAAGAQGGLSDNKKARIELPIELSQPIIIGGFPATLKQTFKFLVQTAFTAKNGNISGTGRWGLTGPIGYEGGSVLTPTFSVQESIMQSLRGVSVGVEAIVVAAEFRFGLMLGLPVAGAGPFVGVVASLGLTNGSAAGRVGLPLAGPAVKCRGTTLVVTARAGEGLNVSAPLAKAIEVVLGVPIPKEATFVSKDIINRTVVEPDVPLCRE
ncbi:hypothetical protein [Micromonospora maris]|uniref:Uncharacterized protein n=1 Tax=Micromonospora maris TaxID=1003110 RepID=A0A9X0LBS3_9ACTN|nr:hypothetical protein [Micromonospora maris]AEB44877.1 hypothetical protein VAB18032_18875 [Micromonospora maris AB-18-032]KUJ44337.1 hypothetical protein ADL17_14105 [Micromonospora maris]